MMEGRINTVYLEYNLIHSDKLINYILNKISNICYRNRIDRYELFLSNPPFYLSSRCGVLNRLNGEFSSLVYWKLLLVLRIKVNNLNRLNCYILGKQEIVTFNKTLIFFEFYEKINCKECDDEVAVKMTATYNENGWELLLIFLVYVPTNQYKYFRSDIDSEEWKPNSVFIFYFLIQMRWRKEGKKQNIQALEDREKVNFIFGLPVCEVPVHLSLLNELHANYSFNLPPPTSVITKPKPCELKLMTICWYVGYKKNRTVNFSGWREQHLRNVCSSEETEGLRLFTQSD